MAATNDSSMPADSEPGSPTDTRGRSHFEPIRPSGGEPTNPTMRRSRPSTVSMVGYGSIMPQDVDTTEGQRTPAPNQSRPGPRRLGSEAQQPPYSPEPIQSAAKPRKPPMVRRSSSRYQTPHKGQAFSVDDDPDEFETDYQQQRQASVVKAPTSDPSLRRQSSTLRRRQTLQSHLPRVDSVGEEEQAVEQDVPLPIPALPEHEQEPIENAQGLDDAVQSDPDVDDEVDLSDAESFTLKDRQQAINQTHPFGIRIWKPALYKKNRSVEKTAEGDIHSSPGGHVDRWLWTFNFLWTILFGWWLAAVAAVGAITCFALSFAPGAADYGHVLWGLAGYLFYPFGQFVKLHQDEAYAEEDEGEGRSITEYEQWQSGDLEDGRLFFGPTTSRSLIGRRRDSIDSAGENDSLLERSRTSSARHEETGPKAKRRLFGRGQWNFGRVIFFIFFYFLIAPLLLLVSFLCWFLVFWIPMGRVTMILFSHLRRHPLALSFYSDAAYSRGPGPQSSSILLCTYRAVGWKYWKYTVDGTNIFLINLIGVVLFAIFDYWVLDVAWGLDTWLVNPGLVFALALFSIIPLAYFIGQAVASISAQSSMGLGAAINAFFSTIVEVFLYCVALNQGKGQLVEGSIIGSIFAGILLLPGLSMCFGAINRKTQRFNVKSAGVTSTMLLFAVIASFGPTLFYQIYGSHQISCHSCLVQTNQLDENCRRCFYSQVPAVNDRFFIEAVRPYCWFAALMLFLSYIIGLWFTLRTHAAVIWNDAVDEKKTQPSGSVSHQAGTPHLAGSKFQSTSSAVGRIPVRDTQLYKRILGQSLKQVGLNPVEGEDNRHVSSNSDAIPANSGYSTYLVPPKTPGAESSFSETGSMLEGLSEEQNAHLVRQVAEMAATAATVAARDAVRAPRKTQIASQVPSQRHVSSKAPSILHEEREDLAGESGNAASGGHDAPNWSRLKSYIILLGATVLYAIIAEILVNTVDVVLESVDIDEKFLGITLFALVPNTTEFLNAISFAMNGNIALSMEIGSAYALQVCLLQIPALVLFSAVTGRFVDPEQLISHTFNLIFPQWDIITVILSVFLLSYVYGEGKSNYFKGSILVLTYLVIVVGFYQAGISSNMDTMGLDRFEVLSVGQQTFRTIGRGSSSGQAFKVDVA